MSGKITSKNLNYEARVPKFLAALRGQASNSSGSPDPLLAARRRPGLKRSDSADAEDAPVIVDEDGNVVDGEVDADGTVRRTEKEAEGEVEGKGDAGQSEGKEGKSAALPSIGRKRKSAKIIGADEEEEETPKGGKAKKSKEVRADDAKTGKPKKKSKKIKLSFDDEGS